MPSSYRRQIVRVPSSQCFKGRVVHPECVNLPANYLFASGLSLSFFHLTKKVASKDPRQDEEGKRRKHGGLLENSKKIKLQTILCPRARRGCGSEYSLLLFPAN